LIWKKCAQNPPPALRTSYARCPYPGNVSNIREKFSIEAARQANLRWWLVTGGRSAGSSVLLPASPRFVSFKVDRGEVDDSVESVAASQLVGEVAWGSLRARSRGRVWVSGGSRGVGFVRVMVRGGEVLLLGGEGWHPPAVHGVPDGSVASARWADLSALHVTHPPLSSSSSSSLISRWFPWSDGVMAPSSSVPACSQKWSRLQQVLVDQSTAQTLKFLPKRSGYRKKTVFLLTSPKFSSCTLGPGKRKRVHWKFEICENSETKQTALTGSCQVFPTIMFGCAGVMLAWTLSGRSPSSTNYTLLPLPLYARARQRLSMLWTVIAQVGQRLLIKQLQWAFRLSVA